jgi:type VI secretion system protein ImpG
MSDDLLQQYNRELSFIRKLGAQFAEEHPNIAERLRLGEGGVAEDPHVERLIQAFAFLSGRVRQKLDDEFPEITESLLGVLYPHYQVPIPALGIVELELAPQQAALEGYPVPAGTPLETEPIDGEPCRFRTGYPVTLWPIEVESAKLARPPAAAPLTPRSARAAAVLRLVLRCRGEGVTWQALTAGRLRFFLKGQVQHVYLLYELIFNHAFEVALASSPADQNPVVLDAARCLQPVGFGRDEGLLPYSPRSFLGYRLLTEFFTFPEKFLFLDLVRPGERLWTLPGTRLEVFLYLDRAAPDLEQHVSKDTFRLGCTPVVNLYRQRAEPIRLTHTAYQYRVVPDARRPLAHEVYTVDRVTATSPDGEQVEYQPFFSVKHAAEEPGRAFWSVSRQPAEAGGGDRGTEVYLSLVDLDLKPSQAGGWTLDVETTCLNRDLPRQLPFGGGQPRLHVREGAALVGQVTSLMQFTPTFRPAQKQGALWRLISHLSLNHLSLVDGDEHGEALREILTLYDFSDSARTRKMIAGISSVQGRRVVGRIGGSTLCRGVEVTILFDEKSYSAKELFLFASVLERFLALYCTVNSFSKLVALVKGGEGELRRWPPRTGERVLI